MSAAFPCVGGPPHERGEADRLRAGRGTGGFGTRPYGLTGKATKIAVGEGSKPSRFGISAEGRTHIDSPLLVGGGRGEARPKGLLMPKKENHADTVASLPQSPAGDSSSVDAEPRVSPAGGTRGGRVWNPPLRVDW